jgi:mannan endo-1,4-beta-mannosidase
VYSQDWGFAKDGDKDSYLARPDIVEEVKRQHRLGSIITICWHAVPPTADEPVTFQRRRNAPAPEKLNTVQGRLTDQQFKDVLTPGTELHQRWCAQVDAVAGYLKQLQEARVPVLWRPYHEMNGDWFWWGGRRGEYSTVALYRQLFERYVNHHKLDNLVWVWSVDRPSTPERQFADYFPGGEYLDIVSLDVYGRDFKQSYYDGLVELADGRPLVLGEVGNPPSLETFAQQPKWSLYVIWAGMVRWTKQDELRTLVNDPRVLSLEDPAYHRVMAPFRAACGLEPLPVAAPAP